MHALCIYILFPFLFLILFYEPLPKGSEPFRRIPQGFDNLPLNTVKAYLVELIYVLYQCINFTTKKISSTIFNDYQRFAILDLSLLMVSKGSKGLGKGSEGLNYCQ